MKANFFLTGVIFTACLALTNSCLDPYNPPATQTELNLLVVDGILNDVSGPTTLRLSRTATLKEGLFHLPESNATVQIEADDGTLFGLPENNPGSYSATNLAIDPAKMFRLKIKTSDNKEYASDFVPFKQTPPIDSVSWNFDNTWLYVTLTTHDDTNASRYYLWNYEETWAYTSAYHSTVKVQDGLIVQRTAADDIFHCWQTLPSTQIEISSSERLVRDVISNYPLTTIPLTSEKLETEYSILVNQVSLPKAAYEYWSELKKNTENIGTVFGPQPSQLFSNIHGVTNPKEPVLGYFSAGTIQQKRIFIFNPDLPQVTHLTGYEDCELDTAYLSQDPISQPGILVTELYSGVSLVGYLLSTNYCVDCRERQGTTTRPPFWK